MELTLTRNLKCIIDEEDYEKISQYKWYAHKSESGRFYAATRGKKNSDLGLNKFCYLHRYLLGINGKETVDHIDGNTLDNRKINLRITNLVGNAANSRKTIRNTSSKYKGVHFFKRGSVWVAQIKGKHIGRFSTEEAAAIAYNEKALILYGIFAKLNNLTTTTKI